VEAYLRPLSEKQTIVKDHLDHYSEETHGLADQRAGHGIVLMTARGRILLIDRRGAELCQQMRVAGTDRGGTLPPPLVKVVNEVAESLESHNHLKDSVAFRLSRVIEGREGRILVAGIGLPAMEYATERRILLTLDAMMPRIATRRLDLFRLTPRELTVVEELLKGLTNKEIAQAMGISEQTTKEHIKHIMDKTATSTRTGIVMAIAGPREMVVSRSVTGLLPEAKLSHGRSVVMISCTPRQN
jgi:DNA-binding NarL/FixJ family response regulator